ncbi:MULTISPECIES: DUF3306 domain-containing protein [Methylobacterium]|uniref:DUF3306 domain-containing protein n=1 Tax=Methylobacterium TaxID=407 RepID=UPI0013EA8B3B|nr:DUF3306 domain-containing protein [Methylobacterium sp. DB0501]NGM36523.1 DUF3306 domain-containing protein [Methylobacterium sp. DB0501]
MSDGFLARWSRRKRDEARRVPDVAPEAAPPVAPGEAPPGDEVVLSQEELAQLPSLDALDPATDLTPFLRAGVPRALRNAALRRMWSIDPAIRDFVSEAREYAYDWNTPGGVPGTGGAISAEDVRAMVEKVFGAGEAPADDPDDDERSAGTPPLACGDGGEGAEVPCAAPSVALDAEQPAFDPAPSPLPPLPLSVEGIPRHSPDRPDPGPEPPPAPPRLRRHGGALPI